jgi:hydroxymethylpyrimidine/phosphomethylpyrimidine kinase
LQRYNIGSKKLSWFNFFAFSIAKLLYKIAFLLSKREQSNFISFFFFYFAKQMSKSGYILTITGSDGSGLSGVQADINVISSLGGQALSAITSITLQNSLGIQNFYDLPAVTVAGEIAAIEDDYAPNVVKIGMVRTVETLKAIISALQKYKPRHIIFDSIVSASFGMQLMGEDVISQIRYQLLPICTLIIVRRVDLKRFMLDEHQDNVLVVDDPFRHGFGNSLSSAIAYYLNEGDQKLEAVDKAKAYVSSKIVDRSGYASRSQEIYKQFVNDVSKHYHTNNDVAFYADCQNVSGRYLAQVTKRMSGKAPKTIIDEYLTEKIMTELKKSNKTIQEIAYYFGFSSQAHFTKFFRKMKNCSPREYRKGEN